MFQYFNEQKVYPKEYCGCCDGKRSIKLPMWVLAPGFDPDTLSKN